MISVFVFSKEAMPLGMEGGRILALGPTYQNNIMGSVRRARGLSDIAPQYVAKVCKKNLFIFEL